MPFINQKPVKIQLSRSLDGDDDDHLLYTVWGTEEEEVAAAFLESNMATTLRGKAFKGYQLAHLGGGVWDADVRYGGPEKDKSEGHVEYTFDTGGGTQKITQSLETVMRAPPGTLPGEDPENPLPPFRWSAPDMHGSIGVTEGEHGRVEGTEILVPVYHFGLVAYRNDSRVTPAYRQTLFRMTGSVNDYLWWEPKGQLFQRGEVLFLGSQGSNRGNGLWEITYKFAASPNVKDLFVGNFDRQLSFGNPQFTEPKPAFVDKEGWQYIWFLYEDGVDPTAASHNKKPKGVYVERVYRYSDFGELDLDPGAAFG